MVGLAVGGWVVMFGREGQVAGEVVYKTPKGKTEHLVVDLQRAAKYKAGGAVGGPMEMTASRAGVLRFRTESAAAVGLRPAK